MTLNPVCVKRASDTGNLIKNNGYVNEGYKYMIYPHMETAKHVLAVKAIEDSTMMSQKKEEMVDDSIGHQEKFTK